MQPQEIIHLNFIINSVFNSALSRLKTESNGILSKLLQIRFGQLTLRMRESYKRLNSFCIVIMNQDSKKVRFLPYETNPDLFRIVDHESLMFSKDSFCRLIFRDLTCFHESNESLRILTNPDESLVHRRTLNKPESILVSKDSFRGFVL